jgi:hypothetical protein
MARRLPSGVLEAFCKYAEPTEAPPIFTVWSGIATVGAILGRDCFVDWGYYTVYPNTYVVLIGSSAITRKSSSIRFAKYFLSRVKPKVNSIGQKLTPEALIGALSGMMGEAGDTKVIPSAVGIAIASELNTFVDANSFRSGMVGILTDLYDCEDFVYQTRGRGEEKVNNPCFSLLGGSTINWVKECIPVQSIMGGFTARIIFVYKEGREKRVPRLHLTADMLEIRDAILHDLNDISKMRGPFALSDDACTLYDKEYNRFLDDSPLLSDVMLQGYAGRRHDMLTKVSMIISASRSNDKVITDNDLATAIAILTDVEQYMPKIIKAITSTEQGDVTEEVAVYIRTAKVTTRQDIVRKFKHKLAVSALNEVLRALDESGWMRTEVNGPAISYIYTGDSLKE